MRIALLDHGYVELVDTWGSDERIIEAARMSTGKGFHGWGPRCTSCGHAFLDGDGSVCLTAGCGGTQRGPGDEKLLRYLWENKHATPFEMAGLTFEVMAPILVFREWHRHRVPFGYSEMSARYVPLPDVNYIPSIERLMIGSDGKNRQAGTIAGAATLTAERAEGFRISLQEMYKRQQDLYEHALANGVPKELARVHLPVGRYSRMRATGNLRGWLGFLALRMAPGAQWEIRQYANAVGEIISQSFQRTWALFSEQRG